MAGSFSLAFSTAFDVESTPTPTPTPEIPTSDILTSRSQAKAACVGKLICGVGPYSCSQKTYYNNAYVPAITMCTLTSIKNGKIYIELPPTLDN